MINREESAQGSVRIYKQALASIVALASLEIEGVKAVGRNCLSNILELSGHKYSEIKVEIYKDSEVCLDIPLVLKYGFNVSEVASKVQENVRSALERSTDLSIKDINISVRSIEKA